jgi:hypothetical protein
MGAEVIGGHWQVIGALRKLEHEVDEKRLIASVDVGRGALTLFIKEKIGDLSNPVVEAARRLVGQHVRAAGDLNPWSGDWVRRPYWLTPSSIQSSNQRR